MRKITDQIVSAFLAHKSKSLGNTTTDGKSLFLHGNEIARFNKLGNLEISNAGWLSNTTKERLNALPNVSIVQKNFQWYLNRKKWNGDWKVVICKS